MNKNHQNSFSAKRPNLSHTIHVIITFIQHIRIYIVDNMDMVQLHFFFSPHLQPVLWKFGETSEQQRQPQQQQPPRKKRETKMLFVSSVSFGHQNNFHGILLWHVNLTSRGHTTFTIHPSVIFYAAH